MIEFGDLFAGGGGTSTGAMMVPDVKVVWAVNHSDIAIKTHARNHPETIHYREDVRTLDVRKLSKVKVLWASLECTNFSIAKGGKEKNADSRTLAEEMPRYILQCDPDYIPIENVREFMKWGPLDKNNHPIKSREGEDYRRWVKNIEDMGYTYEYRLLNAADFEAYTSRTRYFGVFTKIGCAKYQFPKPTHCKKGDVLPKWKACKEILDLDDCGKSIFGRKRPLCPNTITRIITGIKKYYPEFDKFIHQYYGNGGFNGIEDPLNTVTTKDRHTMVTVEDSQFLLQYNGKRRLKSIDDPLNTVTTANRFSMVSAEKKEFLSKVFIADHCQIDLFQSLDVPLNTQTTRQTKQFIAVQNNSNGNPGANIRSIGEPLFSATASQKMQFISLYYNSGGDPGSQNRSLDSPLPTITGVNKAALITFLDGFDVFMRFLNPKELAKAMGFPDGYFDDVRTIRDKVWLIGNAVAVIMSKKLVEMIPDNDYYEKEGLDYEPRLPN